MCVCVCVLIGSFPELELANWATLEPQGSTLCASSPGCLYRRWKSELRALRLHSTLLTEPSPHLVSGRCYWAHHVQTWFVTTPGLCMSKFTRRLKFICNLQVCIPGAPAAISRYVRNWKFWIIGACIPLWDWAHRALPFPSAHICPSLVCLLCCGFYFLFIFNFLNQLDPS